MIETDLNELRPRIVVIGVGGAGGNAVAKMIRRGVAGVEFFAANTDAQALRESPCDRILQLGRRTTGGLGAGSRADIGKAAAEESLPDIQLALQGAHMCFIAAGLGGGTGTGAAPVIARAAKAMGILTVAAVTKPFAFEGARRTRGADAGLEELAASVDALIVIPNQNLFRIAGPATTFKAAFDLADEVLQQGVRGITDLIVMPGMINLDFADIRAIMSGMGKAMMGTGEARGEGRAIQAGEQAISNPLLDEALRGARGVIISITGGEDMRLMEVAEVAMHIKGMVDPEADIIWGSAFDPELQGSIRVSVVATGIQSIKLGQEASSPLSAVTPAQGTLRAHEAAPAPVPFVQTDLVERAAWLEAQAFQTEVAEGELLLTGECILLLTPPNGAAENETLDPFAPVDATCTRERSRRLFERMAAVGRGAVRQDCQSEPTPTRPALYCGAPLGGSGSRLTRAA